ncbi:hypothetical protein BT63DRAFT_276793 [Microthyrium microscopicum]|uniref:Fe2OG dioxygenase domain-containing protein n=1 Tax=Microthyrium microscopicum TaxID=703497 RepID=A0A6A6UA05_9PEZI|nr:hypothetical protein BT63DRAFT_276793 [Microthyrium microscopicum]
MEPETRTGSTLEKYRVPGLPNSFFYISDFLSDEESTALLAKIPPNRWTHLSHRRLQAHPSTLTTNNTLIAAPLPPWLTTLPVRIKTRFKEYSIFAETKHQEPNHVLVNEYQPGQGIMPHEDGNAYSPVVATISLGGSVILELFEKDTQDNSSRTPIHRILQEPGSLLVTTGEAYASLLHGIAPIEMDEDLGQDTVSNWTLLGNKAVFEGGSCRRVTRVSLTYRDVLKVSKIGAEILGLRR